MPDFDVIIAGAGPVGLLLAIDLGQRNVRTLILEKAATTAPWPKMDRCNARSMEIFRRLGIVDEIRARGYPPDNPMNVYLVHTLAEPAIAQLDFPSVGEYRERIAQSTGISQPLEPYQLVSQNAVEPLLKEIAERTPNVTVRYGCGLERYEQDETGVTVYCQTLEGEALEFRGLYLAGCDGGKSLVRKALGIELRGQGSLAVQTQAIFQSEDLYEKIVCGKGRFYGTPVGPTFTAQGSRKEFTFHSMLPEGSDFETAIRSFIGFDCDVRVKHTTTWKLHLLYADKFRDRRVLLAGDSIHLVIPFGGLGLNTGVGDALDLAWKLAGAVQGWGGPKLLDAYEAERRPVAAKNVEASGWAAKSVPAWMQKYTPAIYEDTPAGRKAKRRMLEAYYIYHPRMFGMSGVELGYTYAWSDLVQDEPDNVPEWSISEYVPHTRPGIRIPHIWLKDGSAMQDILGQYYTILDLSGDADTSALEAALTKIGAPFTVVHRDEPHVREVYGKSLYLVRPDLHIAWRGDAPPGDPGAVAAMATGNG